MLESFKMTPLSTKRRKSAIAVSILWAVCALGLTACEGTKAPKPPKLPSIEEIKKQAPIPKEIDVKSYTEGTVVRNEAGMYVVPWHERTTCDGPNSCKSDVINEVTKEVAIKEGVVQAPWRETGKGAEIARPAPAKIEPKTETKIEALQSKTTDTATPK
jgi:hypothetical protein